MGSSGLGCSSIARQLGIFAPGEADRGWSPAACPMQARFGVAGGARCAGAGVDPHGRHAVVCQRLLPIRRAVRRARSGGAGSLLASTRACVSSANCGRARLYRPGRGLPAWCEGRSRRPSGRSASRYRSRLRLASAIARATLFMRCARPSRSSPAAVPVSCTRALRWPSDALWWLSVTRSWISFERLRGAAASPARTCRRT